jgi:hypothetical protein
VKDVVQTHSSIHWGAIAEMVPDQTQIQGHDHVRTGKWRTLEDWNLMAVVQKHGGKDWAELAALVPGRTKSQCYNICYVAPSIDRIPGCTG